MRLLNVNNKYKHALLIIVVLTLAGCANTKNNIPSTNTLPATHTPIVPVKEVYYFDISAGEKCKLIEAPSIKDKRLSIKPVLDNNGDWICEIKPVIYKVTLAVKNIDKVTKNYELECDNPYGLMRECKGWGKWLTEMGPGPYIIESKGLPEVKPKLEPDNQSNIIEPSTKAIDITSQKIEK